MMFEDELFIGYQHLPDQLEAFGFSQTADAWLYKQDLLDGQFEVTITVTKAGRVTGRVLDKELMEDYAPLRQKQVSGSFVGQVRQAYQHLLEQIRTACFSSALCSSQQGQGLMAHLEETYGDCPAQPFAKYPRITAFRHPTNQKWYALFMAVAGDKLEAGRQGQVDILNVKAPPQIVETLLTQPGIYPSYHMNKKHWVTLVLDETLGDEQVLTLLEGSRQLVAPKSRKF